MGAGRQDSGRAMLAGVRLVQEAGVGGRARAWRLDILSRSAPEEERCPTTMIRTGTGQCIDSMSAVPVSHLAQSNHARACEAVSIIHIVHIEITRTTGTVGQGLQDQDVRVASVPGLDWDLRECGGTGRRDTWPLSKAAHLRARLWGSDKCMESPRRVALGATWNES